MKCATCENNEARYITIKGALVCSICPQMDRIDSIRMSDVPKLLEWARDFLEFSKGKPDTHTFPVKSFYDDLVEIVGKDLSK